MTPLDSAGATYVAGNLAPLMNEVTAFDLEIIGRSPEARRVKPIPGPGQGKRDTSVNTNVAMVGGDLEARDFIAEPLATIRLPVRVPFTFHGGWAPNRGATSEQPLI